MVEEPLRGLDPGVDELQEPMEDRELLEPVSLSFDTSDCRAAFGDVHDDPVGAADPSELLERRQLAAVLSEEIDTLDPLQASFIRCRFGLGDAGPMSLDEARAHLRLGRQEAREVEFAALARLRRSARLRGLFGRASEAQRSRLTRGSSRGVVCPSSNGLGKSVVERPDTEGPSLWSLESVMDLARSEFIGVVDERRVGGRLWFCVTSPSTQGQRALVDRLWRMGFDFWPARGYGL